MLDNIYIPNNEELRKLNVEHLEYLYTEGLRRRNVIAKEMEYGRFHDRHFTAKTFGSLPGGIQAHRMNGDTGQLSYNEYYHDWKGKVLSALSSSIVPSYLRLSFTSLPDVLVNEKYRDTYDIDITKIALKTFDEALEKLLDIIKQLPSPKDQTKPEEILALHGPFTLTASNTILKNGLYVSLPPQQVRLMAALIQKKGKVLLRSEFIDAVWNEENASDTYLDKPNVTAQGLNKTISNLVSKLNTRLKDTNDRKRYVIKAPDGVSYYLSS